MSPLVINLSNPAVAGGVGVQIPNPGEVQVGPRAGLNRLPRHFRPVGYHVGEGSDLVFLRTPYRRGMAHGASY